MCIHLKEVKNGSYGNMKAFNVQYDFLVSDLPHCSTLSEAELASMTDCDNSTIVEEVRLRDPLFERLFSQLWHDTQVNLNYSSSRKLSTPLHYRLVEKVLIWFFV